MYLNDLEIKKADNIRVYFLKVMSDDDRKSSICPKCNGTGLNATFFKSTNSYSWDGVSFCDFCKGVGFIEDILNKLKDNGIYICEFCNGTGCEKCKNTGFFDWVENITKTKQNNITLKEMVF